MQIAAADGDKREIACRVYSAGGNRMELLTAERVAPFTPIAVEYDDALFLTEVVACTQAISGEWHLEMRIEQILTGLQSLMNLRANLLGEPAPASASRMTMAASRSGR